LTSAPGARPNRIRVERCPIARGKTAQYARADLETAERRKTALIAPLVPGHEQLGQLGVAVLLDKPRHTVAPVPIARLADNRERRREDI
jgi:hypothetical protein